MRSSGAPLPVTLLTLLALLGGCLRSPAPHIGTGRPPPQGTVLGLLEVEVRFAVDPPALASTLAPTARNATAVYVGPPRDPNTFAAAAAPVTSRTDFQVISAQRVSAGGLTYITLEVQVTNRTGSSLTNLTLLGYSSKNVSFSGSAVTRYAQGSGSNPTAARRVTPFLFAPAGDPLGMIATATVGTTFFAAEDPAFVDVREALTGAGSPYRAIVAEVFPYGFVANPQGHRTLPDQATGTLYLSFRVEANTTVLSWRGVIVQDPIIRLGLPAEVVGVENLAAYLQRLIDLSGANGGAKAHGVVIGNVDHLAGQRVIEIRDNTFHDYELFRNAFVAGSYRVDAIADVKLSEGDTAADHWLQAPTETPSDLFLLEQFTTVGPHTFEAPVPSGGEGVEIEYLIVAGGGGAGNNASAISTPSAGGGAGGLLRGTKPNLGAATPYPIAIGGGGPAAPTSAIGLGAPGEDSSAFGLTAVGGGGGGGFNPNAAGSSGGSGGGSNGLCPSEPVPGGAGVAGQGHPGGRSVCQAATGGGGAGGPGVNAPAQGVNGAAGPGLELDMAGHRITYATGGEPGLNVVGFIGRHGSDGLGEGGQGSGRGSGSQGGNGGSGIVIVRYRLAQP
jgi:hypothetical protein